MTINDLLGFTYVFVFAVFFLLGFRLVKRCLERVNIIEGEPFRAADWIVTAGFGFMFGIVVVFAVNLALDWISPVPIPSVAGYVLLILLGILLVYPVWEMLYLAGPRSDAVTDYHKFLEQKVVDKIRGKGSIAAALGLYALTYIVPVIILDAILEYSFFQLLFVWMLCVPLFFLNYFAASGQVANILKVTYMTDLSRKFKALQSPATLVVNVIKLVVVIVPFGLSVYNLASPVVTVVQGSGFEQKVGTSAYISLFTTVVFGIQGFFTRFWNKKSKTRAIDFLFSGYIMVAIGANLLINFVSIDSSIVQNTLGITVFGIQPLAELIPVFSNYAFLLPAIIMQSAVTVVYGVAILLNKNSRVQVNTRLAAVNEAYSFPSDKDLFKLKKQLDGLDKKIRKAKGSKKEQIEARKRLTTIKTRAPNIVVLLKSLFLKPAFDRYGVDLNEEIRHKAAQYLSIMATTGVERNRDDEIISFLIKQELGNTSGFVSKEAYDVLGIMGKVREGVSGRILSSLAGALETTDLLRKRCIMDAMGDIGSVESNARRIIDGKMLDKMLSVHDASFEVKRAAMAAIVEMGTRSSGTPGIVEQLRTILVQARESRTPASDYIVESALHATRLLALDHEAAIDTGLIVSMLDFHPSTGDEDTAMYIMNETLRILAYLVHRQHDAIPVDKIVALATARGKEHVRNAACEVLGNYILKRPRDDLIAFLVERALQDPDPDVRDTCIESVAEYCIQADGTDESFTVDGKRVRVIDHFLAMVRSSNATIAERASEALKSLAPHFDDGILDELEAMILQDNEEVIRDCVHVLPDLPVNLRKRVNVGMLSRRMGEVIEPATLTAIIRALGFLGQDVVVDVNEIIKHARGETADVRLNAIFALGKIATLQPGPPAATLLGLAEKLDTSIASLEATVIIEALGVAGSACPSNEIISFLERKLIGDANPFLKDVVAIALREIASGLMRRCDRDPAGTTLNYRLGNIIMIFVHALQQKGLPMAVIDVVSDCIQDLLPYFILHLDAKVAHPKHQFEYLNTLQSLLVQAYNSNFSHEILETMDRIASLKAFKLFVDEKQQDSFKEQSRLLSMDYTPDGKQFYDQGMLFSMLGEKAYALASFEIAVELAPHEIYSPRCLLEIGRLVHETTGDVARAMAKLEEARKIFTFFDDIARAKQCEDEILRISS